MTPVLLFTFSFILILFLLPFVFCILLNDLVIFAYVYAFRSLVENVLLTLRCCETSVVNKGICVKLKL